MSEPEHTTDLDGLYRELYPSLVRFSQGILGSRTDAEDAVHDAFVAAARSEPAKDARPWLFRVTRNASIDLLRRRRTTVEIDQLKDSLPGAAAVEPHASAELNEKLALMRSALDALPERGRTALLLRELGGLPYPEIGQVLDTTEGNVKVMIFRARASLHEYTEAAELECSSVRTALSAAADGEAGRLARARARLHSSHCKHCRDFGRSITSQRAAIGALVPLVGTPHAFGLAGGAVSGGMAGAKVAAAKVATGVAVAAATIGVSAGGVAVWTSIHPQPHLPQRAALGPPVPVPTAAGEGRNDSHERAADDTIVGEDDSGSATRQATAPPVATVPWTSSSGETEDASLRTVTPVTASYTTPVAQQHTSATASDSSTSAPDRTEHEQSDSGTGTDN